MRPCGRQTRNGENHMKRSHHGNKMEELERLRRRRRLKRYREHPPLYREPPSLLDIRDALSCVGTSYRAMLHLGWLVHWLQRTAGNEAGYNGKVFLWAESPGNLIDSERAPSVRNLLCQAWYDMDSDKDVEVDLNSKYKTLMRYKRLYERFMASAGLSADESEAVVFEEPVRKEIRAQVESARAFLARCDGTGASLFRALNGGAC